jgi:hypothetical protein
MTRGEGEREGKQEKQSSVPLYSTHHNECPSENNSFYHSLLALKLIYVETENTQINSKKKSVRPSEKSVRPSEVCDFLTNNVPNINKKSDFYDINTKYPFHRVKLAGFTQKRLA